MDYIYSRNRFFLSKFNKPNKKQNIKLALLAFAFIILISFITYIYSAYPIFVASCKTRANSVATNIVNDEVNKVMSLYNYEDLVNVEKDEKGKISMISAKIVPINNIVAEIVTNIQKNIDSKATEKVYVNLGKVSGFTILSHIGPTFTIELERAGSIQAKMDSEFEDVGINQTLHKINLTLYCNINVLTPIEVIDDTVETKILLTETVIVGEVPSAYYNLDNLGFENALYRSSGVELKD